MIRFRAFRGRLLAAGLVAGLSGWLSLTAGCSPRQTVRPQAADDPDKDAGATVGAKTAVGNYDAIPVSGIGLVYDLKGTGSNPAPDEWRKMLENALRKQKFGPDQVKQFLDDPDKSTSLVMVSAVIHRGARQGDKLDVVVTLPPGSKTTGLTGGRLHECDLTNFELAGAVREQMAAAGVPTGKVPVNANQLMLGNRMATATGPLVAGALLAPDAKNPAGRADEAKPTVAKVWGGATCLLDRPYYFLLNDSARQPQLAMAIAARLNAVFHGTTDRGAKVAEAKVQGQRPMVLVNVPPAYRLNHDRFLLVARQVPLVSPSAKDHVWERLKQDLLQPETAVTAAVKLEGLGADAADTLRIGLEHDAPWVRFAAAQSLVYLGKADARVAAQLGHLAEKHPGIRTHCLTALASQDDSPCMEQLADLMRKGDPTLRYGAFTALRAANEHHEAVRPRPLAGSPYALHVVAAESEPLIHLRTDRRNEVVLFGTVWPITGKFSLPLGSDFTVSGDDTGSVKVSRVVPAKAGDREAEATTVDGTYRADLSAVLKGLAELGGGYGEAVELVRRLNAGELLAAKVAVDSAPRGMTIQKLALVARNDPTLSRADKEVERAMKDGTDGSGGYDLPAEAEAGRRVTGTEPAKPDDGKPLNRNPGSLLGR